jgi:outer membrane protein assembly factor BamB
MKVVLSLTKPRAGVLRSLGGVLLRSRGRLVAALLAFACGALLVHALRREPPANTSAAYAVSPLPCDAIASALVPAETASCEEEEVDTPELEAWKDLHSGTRLGLDYGSTPSRARPSDSKVVALPSGRTIAALRDALYMLGTDGRAVWKLDVPQTVFDFAYVGATGLVYVTAGDNNLMILDAATGRVLRNESRNGSAAFGVTIPYGEDACLVTDDFSGYRGFYYGDSEPMRDGVAAWRGTKMLWRVEIPPDAELQVVGSRIFAVTKTSYRILVKEIKTPRGKR